MPKTPARLILKLATALIACLALASPASAAVLKGKNSDAYFKATLKGTQTNTWTEDHKPQFKCDSASKGSGTEKIKFASKKPVTLRAFRFMGGPVMWLVGKGAPDIATKGTVTRNGTMTRDPVTQECAVGDGDGSGTYTPPPSDCGTKAFSSLVLRVAYDALNKKRLTLSNNNTPDTPRFQQCPSGGTTWPTILSSDDKNRTAGVTLPVKDLYDKRQGKMILIGRGTVRQTSSWGVTSTTKVTWELTLTRLKK